jgi:hypothetical protein
MNRCNMRVPSVAVDQVRARHRHRAFTALITLLDVHDENCLRSRSGVLNMQIARPLAAGRDARRFRPWEAVERGNACAARCGAAARRIGIFFVRFVIFSRRIFKAGGGGAPRT